MIFFDGLCNLCNAWVRRIIRWDKKALFRFASLQGNAGSELLNSQPQLMQVDSLLLLHKGKVHTQSGAVLRIAGLLGFPVNLLLIFLVVPAFLRNAIYRLVAKNRYRWFGKQNECMVSKPEIQNRFLK